VSLLFPEKGSSFLLCPGFLKRARFLCFTRTGAFMRGSLWRGAQFLGAPFRWFSPNSILPESPWGPLIWGPRGAISRALGFWSLPGRKTPWALNPMGPRIRLWGPPKVPEIPGGKNSCAPL